MNGSLSPASDYDISERLPRFWEMMRLARLMTAPERSMDIVLFMIRQALDHESGVFFLYDEGRLRPVSVYGQFVDMAQGVSFTAGQGLSSWVAREKRPIVLSSIERRREQPENPVRSFMSFPLIHQNTVLGVVNLAHSRPGAFNRLDLDVIMEAIEPVAPLVRKLRGMHEKAASGSETLRSVIDAERLSAVRQTVVSVNHEINNPLSVMMLCADLLSRTGLEDETMRHHVEEIRAHAERIASFIKRLNQIQTLVLKDYLPGLVQMLDVERSTSAGAGPNAESEGQGVFATLNIKEDAPCRFMSP